VALQVDRAMRKSSRERRLGNALDDFRLAEHKCGQSLFTRHGSQESLRDVGAGSVKGSAGSKKRSTPP
jgi:hypothetical protein